jgi:hypothetical protein
MMTFDGLYSYEVAILVGGGVLFLVLVLVLLRQVLTNRKYAALLPFFLVSIAMMGFPAITKIQIDKGTLEIDKTTHELQNKPQDKETRTALEADLSKIASRPIRDPNVLTTLAKAQFALGHDEEAESNVNKVLTTAPNLTAAAELKTKIDLTKNLTKLTIAAESEPDNPRVREELQSTYSKLKQAPVANPKALETMSRARLVLEKKAVTTEFAK